jgi:hypothetical protein
LADPILILHFVLVSINSKGNPASLIAEMLGGFLAEATLAYKEIVFDLATDRLVRDHTEAMTTLVRTLEG